MNFKKIIFLFLFFYFLTIMQTSFLVHFRVFGRVCNIVLLLVFFLNLLEPRKEKTGLISALIGGFFLDIFSSYFFGFYILISLVIAFFIKLVVKKYVRLSFPKRI